MPSRKGERSREAHRIRVPGRGCALRSRDTKGAAARGGRRREGGRGRVARTEAPRCQVEFCGLSANRGPGLRPAPEPGGGGVGGAGRAAARAKGAALPAAAPSRDEHAHAPPMAGRRANDHWTLSMRLLNTRTRRQASLARQTSGHTAAGQRYSSTILRLPRRMWMTLGPFSVTSTRSEKSASLETMVSPFASACFQIRVSLQSAPRSCTNS